MVATYLNTCLLEDLREFLSFLYIKHGLSALHNLLLRPCPRNRYVLPLPPSPYPINLHSTKLTTAPLALYYFRDRWIHRLPVPDYIYDRLPSSFAGDIEEGFSTQDFNLSENIVSGDSRAGLDPKGKREVRNIMRRQRVGFDEARRIYMENKFSKNGIGPDGRPRDPKFVSFS